MTFCEHTRCTPFLRQVMGGFGVLLLSTLSSAQQPTEKKLTTPVEAGTRAEAAAKTPEKVVVKPVARDDEIADRLTKILNATGWFRNSIATVNQGVVTLQGQTDGETFKKWAGDLAHNTGDVVAVVNQIVVDDPPLWDSSAVLAQLKDLGRATVNGLPTIAFALLVLPLAWLFSRLLSRLLYRLLNRSIKSDLLRRVSASGVGLLIFLMAVYLVLRVAGLTQVALTLAGGTGLLGLALGIAFREITENFLASIYLSIQKPFDVGDLVEVTGLLGYVQRVTARTTILMTLDGNHVQIPNATVFKNTIRNFTSNPNRRVDFVIGIGYEMSIPFAQDTALQVLRDHPAVLKDPEPWVLVDSLAASTVNLRIYLWLNGKEHSWLKVRSAVIRLTKAAFQQADISLPDESREIVFPDGVPVHWSERPASIGPAIVPPTSVIPDVEPQPVSSRAEGGLTSEAGEIEEQAKHARMPEAGANLLQTDGNGNRPPP
ncbi:mechanosensitive ion channel family protein [soil metagenome]